MEIENRNIYKFKCKIEGSVNEHRKYRQIEVQVQDRGKQTNIENIDRYKFKCKIKRSVNIHRK